MALPCQHLGGMPFVEEIVSHEIVEDTSADHLCEGLKAAVVELGGLKKDEGAVISVCGESFGRGDPVKVEMSVQIGTTSVGKDHSAKSGIVGGAGAGFADSGFKSAEKDSLDSMFMLGILEKEADAFGHGQHQMPERDKGEHVIYKMRRCSGHVLCIATRT